MARDIPIPKLGMTMKEAKVLAWKFGEGDWIEVGAAVLEIETAKVTHEVEAPASGYLHILAQAGATLRVGEPVGALAETQEELAALQAVSASTDDAEAGGTSPSIIVAQVAKTAAPPQAGGGRVGRAKVSPLAKKVAEEHGLDISNLTGSGPGGRIIKEDVENALAERNMQEVGSGEAIGLTAAAEDLLDGKRVKKRFPLAGMRKAIADHMIYSLQVAAQLTTLTEMDMTEMIRWRKQLVERENSLGFRATYTDLMVYILARVLKAVPMMNASLADGQVVIWHDINIGVAVALQTTEYESGLIVPVVRNADRKSLAEINRVLSSVVQKARAGTILPDDVTGSTFTLTNTGVLDSGWTWGTPIINQPESAILQTGPIMDRPAVVNGQVGIRSMMPVSVTFDHRVLDGAPVATFLEKLRDMVQNPVTVIA